MLIVDLPKLKTHSFTAFTGAVKNMFGVIPCGSRLDLHSRFPGSEAFSRALVDIFACIPPRLTLMDAIVAMDGPGPAGGAPRPVGLVLAGRDAVAVDAVAQSLVGFGPEDVATTVIAARRGLGRADLRSIEIAGESLARRPGEALPESDAPGRSAQAEAPRVSVCLRVGRAHPLPRGRLGRVHGLRGMSRRSVPAGPWSWTAAGRESSRGRASAASAVTKPAAPAPSGSACGRSAGRSGPWGPSSGCEIG